MTHPQKCDIKCLLQYTTNQVQKELSNDLLLWLTRGLQLSFTYRKFYFIPYKDTLEGIKGFILLSMMNYKFGCNYKEKIISIKEQESQR
jgi:hypothetical protein